MAENIQEDTIVIIKENNIPIMKWPLGRIIKVNYSILIRTIHRLAPLVNPSARNTGETTAHLEETGQCRKRNHQEGEGAEETSAFEPSEMPSRQRKKRTVEKVFLTVLFTCLPVRTINTKEVEVVKFSQQPGIHFESSGEIKLISSYWKLVVYFDLQLSRIPSLER
ncbi:unnamed protein product [Hermetia illucens]|uniref:DUF5641 domain-containing protein n=1 Tax=Hermetia illucens TaxID=343691 RepID=A0A7R8Z0U0_HERIL|nr:unnamed protein product [Hermetia illucens]